MVQNMMNLALEGYKDKFESVKIAEPLLGEVGADATVINADKAAVAEAITEAVKDAGFLIKACEKTEQHSYSWDMEHPILQGKLFSDADTDGTAWI